MWSARESSPPWARLLSLSPSDGIILPAAVFGHRVGHVSGRLPAIRACDLPRAFPGFCSTRSPNPERRVSAVDDHPLCRLARQNNRLAADRI